MELSLAIVRDFNPWLAIAIAALAAGVAVSMVNRKWAVVSEAKQQQEHKAKMFQLETERRVKLDVSRLQPPNTVEHRALESRDD